MITKLGGKVKNKTLLPQWELITPTMGAMRCFWALITPSVGVCGISKITLKTKRDKGFNALSENYWFYPHSSHCGRP
jgi:hypothetical protein